MIKPIKKVNVSDEVFEQMKKLIIAHEWKPGEKLPSENELCNMFNVSRVTVRNALQKLVALDLVETRLGDGSYIKKIDEMNTFNHLLPTAYFEENIDSILEFRREIESGTCAIAAGKATEEDVAELREILAEMDGLQGDLEKLAEADSAFHYKIAQISRNSLIIKTYEIIIDIYSSHMKRMVTSMGGSVGVVYHKKIVDAIEAHDVNRARSYMAEHIAKNEEFIHTKEEEKQD